MAEPNLQRTNSPFAQPVPGDAPSDGDTGAHVAEQRRPDGLGEQIWDPKACVKIPDLIKAHGELSTFEAEADRRAAALPTSADGYKPGLPSDFNLPDGWTLDPTDPVWTEARIFAKESGLDQAQLSKLAVIYTEARIREETTNARIISDALKARDAALGGAPRAQAVESWVDATFDARTAMELKALLVTANQVRALEALRDALVGQGQGQSNSQAGGTPRPVARADGMPKDRDKMSPVDRRTWQLAQRQ